MAQPNRRNRRFVRGPSVAELQALAAKEFLTLDDDEAARYAEVLGTIAALVEELEEIPLESPVVRYGTRDSGKMPTLEEDPYNAFTRRCLIEGKAEGPLAGMTFAVKDNIAVGGIPTTNGSRTLSYTPHEDAVVVERILEAGGTLVGKLNLDDFGSGPTGETSYFGPSRNPVNPNHSAGGSAGGGGAAVRAGDVDFALGVDQGGSGRIPASFCGVTALKATHGLIPSHGVEHVDHTLDHVTPMARSVAVVAKVLDVVAGPDPRDPQWVRGDLQVWRTALDHMDLSAISVGVVSESLKEELAEPEVLDRFEHTAELLRDAGARVEPVSIPLWDRGWDILGILLMHLAGTMIKSEGAGYGHLGAIDSDRVHNLAVVRRTEADQFPPLVKTWLLGERYFRERYFNMDYARAHNLRLLLRRQVEEALSEHTVLLTPTTPIVAPRLADGVMEETLLMGRVSAAVYNTAPLNLSGHPALALPNGKVGSGLPTSVQVIGRHFTDRSVLAFGHELEQTLTHSG